MSRRPLTIWVIQVILAFFSAGILVAAIVMLSRVFSVENPPLSYWLRVLLTVLNWSLILGLFAFAFRGLQKRKPYGRWISLGLLFLWWGFNLYSALEPGHSGLRGTPSNGPIPTFPISDAELPGAIIAEILVQLFLLTLIFRLLFAKSVKDFFAVRPAEPFETENDFPFSAD